MGLPSERTSMTKDFLENLSINDHVMVTEINGCVVGIATLEVRHGKLHYSGNISIAIHDDYQNQGIGGLLLDTLLDLADNYLGLIRLELDVTAENERAINLYTKRGFEIEGRLKKAHFIRGQFQDVLIMGRVL